MTESLNPGLLRLVNTMHQSRLADLEVLCRDEEWTLWRMNGAADAATLFAQAGDTLPSPFPQRSVRDWDAFTDSLWEAAATSDATTFAFVWTDVQRMLEGGLSDLLAGAGALRTFSRTLMRPASPGATPKTCYIFLMGTGPNFPLAPGPS